MAGKKIAAPKKAGRVVHTISPTGHAGQGSGIGRVAQAGMNPATRRRVVSKLKK